MSRLLKSFAGSFVARSGLSLVEFLGVLYVATAAGPSVLGTYVLFRVVFVVVSMVLDFGTREATIKRIAEGDDRGAYLSASLFTKAGLLVPVAVAVVTFRGPLAGYVGSPLVVPFVLVLAVLEVVVETIYAGLHGQQRVGRAELSLFVRVAGKVAVWLVVLPLGYGLYGLLVGVVVGRVLQLLVGVRLLSIRPRIPDRRHFRRLFRFGRYSWLGTVRERAWIWTDTLFLGLFVTSEVVGVYELGWQLSAAFFLVASAISSTLFANVDRLLDREGSDAVRRVVEVSLVYTGVAAIPGVAGALVVGRSLLSAVGPEYAVGYVALVVLVVARLAHCYEVVFEKVVNALDRPDLIFRVDLAFVGLNVVGNLLAIAAVGWVGAAVATTVAMVVRTVMAYRYLDALVDVPIPGREIAMEVLAAAVMAVVLFGLTRGRSLTPVETVAVVGGGGLVYVATLLALDGRIRLRVRTLVGGLV
ncbi:MAG: lipopolysaccharide biosynthesis protein [Haloarculaceae archaeon]